MATREPKNKKNRVLINGIWYWRFSYDGKQFLGHTRDEAIAKRDAYKNSNKLSRDASVAELIDWWINSIYMKDSSIRDSTKSLHVNAFHSMFDGCKLLNERIDDINGTDLQRVFSSSSVGGTTQRHCRSFLRRFFKYCMANGLASVDASATLVIPEARHKRQNQQIEVFSEDEIKTFIECTPEEHRLRLLIILAIKTGCRIGELLALEYSDIENGTIIINKSLKEIQPIRIKGEKTRVEIQQTKTASSVRTLPLDDAFVQKAISIHKNWHQKEMLKNGYRTNNVFTTETGSLYYISSVRTAFTRLCKDIGIDGGHFHKFRDTFGSRLAEKGVPIEIIAKLLGHDNISVTAKYYVNVPHDSMREAMAKIAL